jgi:hypothetical protein
LGQSRETSIELEGVCLQLSFYYYYCLVCQGVCQVFKWYEWLDHCSWAAAAAAVVVVVVVDPNNTQHVAAMMEMLATQVVAVDL